MEIPGSTALRGLPLLLFLGAAHAAPVTKLDADLQTWTGDFDGMLERRTVRVLVPYSRTLFFNDRGAQRGLVGDSLKDFEIYLNRRYKLKNRPFTVVALPTTREQLLPGLLQGKGDIAVGNLTITAERGKSVDFSIPVTREVVEIVVTGPASPKIASLDDLAGLEVHVRKSSSYHESLARLNQRFREQRKREMKLTLVPEALEDEDMMDMLGVGLLKLIVVDDWKAKLWAELLPKIEPRPDLAVSSAGDIAWAFRKGSPKLEQAVNRFIRTHPGITAARFKNYPAYLKRLQNATADADWRRFEQTVELFRTY